MLEYTTRGRWGGAVEERMRSGQGPKIGRFLSLKNAKKRFFTPVFFFRLSQKCKFFCLLHLYFCCFCFCFPPIMCPRTPQFLRSTSPPLLSAKTAIFLPLDFKLRQGRQFPKKTLPAKIQFLPVFQYVFPHVQICRGLREYEVLVGARNGLVLSAF